nr:XdhC family protein [Oscillospiraceae bacterium]
MANREFSALLRRVEAGQSATLTRSVGERTYLRRFVPPERLLLLGGGHVSLALARAAAPLDYAVTVADDRAAFANAARFPMAERVLCSAFDAAIAAFAVRADDAVCILTRGHRWDGVCLRTLLQGTEPAYLGMIGSKRRVAGLFGALREEGFDASRIERIHAPIGLMIGAVTPEEIAVSIAAQLIACRRARPVTADAAAMTQTNTDAAALRFLARGGGPRALCLVLDTAGSTPVKSGALMAVDALGRGYGTIGGGC